MYRVSPFTYLINGMLATGLANTEATCADIEYSTFDPREDETCGDYVRAYIKQAGGYVLNPDATSQCRFCPIRDTNVYLRQLVSEYSTRWRNFGMLYSSPWAFPHSNNPIGIMFAFIIFNIAAALFFYWLARVPRKQKVQESPPAGATRTRTAASRQQTKESKVEA